MDKNLVFIDSMQFMDSNLDKLVKNLSDKDLKYLVEEFGSENLELLKQKGVYPYEYMSSLVRFEENEYPNKESFFSSTKKGKIGDDGKILDGHISDEHYLTCKKIWDEFDIKNMGDITIIILKKVFCYQLMFLKSLLTCA